MAALAVNDEERKIGHMLASATISIMEVTVATSREKMAPSTASEAVYDPFNVTVKI